MAILGTQFTVAPADSSAQLVTPSSVQQEMYDSVNAIAPSAGWITHLGVMVRASTGTTPKVSLGIWEYTGAIVTARLIARTDPVAVTSVMHNVEAPIAWVNPAFAAGGNQSAVRLAASQRFYIGFVNYAGAGAGNLLFGLQAGSVSRGWWRATNASGLPLNPFGAVVDSFLITLVFGLYAQFTASGAPTSTLTLPLDNATIASTTPTFEGNFSDPDTARGDVLSFYNLVVADGTTGAQIWNQTFAASAGEAAAGHVSRIYGGPALTPGVLYAWNLAVQDATGIWSAYPATRYFTIASTAIVDSTGGAPTGKVDGDSSQISFSAHWWHTANIGATAVQVRILDAAQSTVVKEGPETAKSIAAAATSPGTAFTVTPTEAGIGNLPYGTSYYWQIRARASNGQLSAYSTPVAFRTNAIPSTPVIISPANNAFSTTLPALVIASTDADADDVPLTDVVFDYEITQLLTGQIRTAIAGSYNSALGRATFQTTSTQLPAEGPYSWRARARDVSAGTVGITPYSAPQTFNFGAGPVVTVTAPASGGTVGTATPRITWTSDDVQTAFQVSIYNVNANGTRGALITATPKVLSASLFYDVPVGLLVNNTQYELVVSSWDDGDFQGTSSALRFNVAFLVVTPLTNVTATVVPAAHDIEPTTPLISWGPTTFPTIMSATGKFTAYVVKRWDVATGRAASEVILAEITNAAQTSLSDYHAPPGRSLQYAVLQRITRSDGGNVDSAETLVTPLTVTLNTPVISVVSDPGTLRFPVMWLGANLSLGKKRRRSTYQTWGAGGVPSVAEAPGVQNLRDFSFTILADQYGSLYAHLDAIEAVADAAGPICFRDSRRRFFMSIVNYSAKRGSSVGKIDVSMSLEQLGYVEGV